MSSASSTKDIDSEQEAENSANENLDFFAKHVSIRERFHHFTWAWFTMTMSTGGISNLLGAQPHSFSGLRTIGAVVFIVFIVMLAFNCSMITFRFISLRKSLQKSLTHPTESLFFACSWLSFAVLLLNMQNYGVPSCGEWLIVTLRVLFWAYVALTFIVAVAQYFILFQGGKNGKHMTLHSMTPAWILPVFPNMLAGTIASSIGSSQPPAYRFPILVAGVACQGLGFLISLIMTGLFLYRLMVNGLPHPRLRPGIFMAVGPPSFTSLAFIGMANNLPREYTYFVKDAIAVDVLQTLALVISVSLWFFGFFFFCIAVVACMAKASEMSFSLVYWAFIFPNTGFTMATIEIGNQLESEGIRWVATAMTILLVVVWVCNIIMQIRAIIYRRMLWPGEDEDRDVLRPSKDE
ncbi:hypothetical protein CC78DRAFT_454101 [Lojkania enalia]|uniref:C4-dicarboxylate transporter/malic acid transport protein n=1 Tax=Lojkania enalia TaxID=147567 RepID=A0A9P4N9F8_9PLEO|nr:hypothetical protein CC78DRAFT_454101 [Didymosphaeria enalia]